MLLVSRLLWWCPQILLLVEGPVFTVVDVVVDREKRTVKRKRKNKANSWHLTVNE